jgi:DNA repair exonuclease SbcCD ATPase subunit
MSGTGILAQNDSPDAAQRAENLRTQLQDVQSKEAELQMRVQQLDVELRPESIERYFAAAGSTRPEELREQRRRQLQNEKESALARLDQLAASRTRLESAILTADGEAYQQSAQLSHAVGLSQKLGAKHLSNTVLFAGVLGLIILVALVALVALILRRRHLDRMRFTVQ